MTIEQPALVPGLVTLGETLALLTTRDPERLRHAHELVLAVGGAESNTAIGVSRLGARATWIGRVGDDELGALVVRTLRAEDVRVAATLDPDVPTSLMLKERPSATSARVSYYRAGGPGARLRPADLDRELIAAAGVLHLTGITPALSPSARETVRTAVAIAREAGVPVSFDVNYRSKLWAREEASRELLALAALADHVFVGHDEAQALGWPGDPAALGAWLRERDPRDAGGDADAARYADAARDADADADPDAGRAARGARDAATAARVVVVKLGADGALAVTAEGTHPVTPVPIVPVDPVGAGDAFAAGYLAELLAGRELAVRLRTAAACGAAACTTRGDWEALPTRAELARLEAPEEVVR